VELWTLLEHLLQRKQLEIGLQLQFLGGQGGERPVFGDSGFMEMDGYFFLALVLGSSGWSGFLL
jgi:hypothetical protein